MLVTVFVLGLPGSGKSAAIRHIINLMQDQQKIPQHFRDYGILYKMYKEEKEGTRFVSTEDEGYDGFNVIDPSAFDDALEELNQWVVQENGKVDGNEELIIIEFSRDDYCKALNFFNSLLTQNTYILFIDTEIPICKQRIKKRVKNPKTPDDHYVSEYIFEAYYKQDHRNYANLIAAQLKKQFGIRDKNIRVIDNGPTVSEEQFYEKVKEFVEDTLRQSL